VSKNITTDPLQSGLCLELLSEVKISKHKHFRPFMTKK
jgi:hypothetical protein